MNSHVQVEPLYLYMFHFRTPYRYWKSQITKPVIFRAGAVPRAVLCLWRASMAPLTGFLRLGIIPRVIMSLKNCSWWLSEPQRGFMPPCNAQNGPQCTFWTTSDFISGFRHLFLDIWFYWKSLENHSGWLSEPQRGCTAPCEGLKPPRVAFGWLPVKSVSLSLRKLPKCDWSEVPVESGRLQRGHLRGWHLWWDNLQIPNLWRKMHKRGTCTILNC